MRDPRPKTFDALAVGSLMTGILLMEGGMGPMQDLVEHLAGHPVWTHELIDKALMARVRERVLEAYPEFPVERPHDWESFAADLTRRYPDGLTFRPGTATRTEDPISSALRLREEAADA